MTAWQNGIEKSNTNIINLWENKKASKQLSSLAELFKVMMEIENHYE